MPAGRVLHEGRPVGYIQYYTHDDEEKREYGLGYAGTAYGMDMFIGAPELWNKGIGTQVVSLVEVRGTNDSLVHPRGAQPEV